MWRPFFVALMLVACWVLLALMGASHFVLVHVFYLPVLLAAFWLGVGGALVVAVLAGLLAGPLLPAELVPRAYVGYAWVFRLGFFVGFGVLASVAVSGLRRWDAFVRHLYARTLRGFVRALQYGALPFWWTSC